MLVALHANDTPFELRTLGQDTPQHAAEWLRRWPLRKFPLLVDGARDVVETSIIIEYLHLARPGPVRLLPADPEAALTGDPAKRGEGLAVAAERLEIAYAWLEGRLVGRSWAAGADFTMADCAAAPSLFYADWTHRMADAYPLLRAYRARLLARRSYARAVDAARRFRAIFPLGAPQRD